MKPPKLHWSFKDSYRRAIESLAPILQIVLGATAGYSIAFYGLGHALPLLAVTVTITALGFSRDARPRRVLETALGMITGIALDELERSNKSTALITLCIGGGMGTATVIERV